MGKWKFKCLGLKSFNTTGKHQPFGQNMVKEWTASVQILEEDSGRGQLHARTNSIANDQELEKI
jgi:hypothetical protein